MKRPAIVVPAKRGPVVVTGRGSSSLSSSGGSQRHFKPEKHAIWTRKALDAPIDPLTTTLS